MNRGKRGLTLNLKHERGREILWRLLEGADVLVENFRPGTLGGWASPGRTCGAPPAASSTRRSRATVRTGPGAAGPGYDAVVQGEGGLMSMTGPAEGDPCKVGASVADVVAGMTAFQGILLALLRRARPARADAWRSRCSRACSPSSPITRRPICCRSGPGTSGQSSSRPGAVRDLRGRRTATSSSASAASRSGGRSATCSAQPGLEADPRFATNAQRVTNYDALRALLAPRFRSAARRRSGSRRSRGPAFPAGACGRWPKPSTTRRWRRAASSSRSSTRPGRGRYVGSPIHLDGRRRGSLAPAAAAGAAHGRGPARSSGLDADESRRCGARGSSDRAQR